MMEEKNNNKFTNSFDKFNLMKYRILMSVAILNSLGRPATTRAIWEHMSSIYRYDTLSSRISAMTNRELIAQRANIKGCVFKYKLSAQGKRNLRGYQERHKNGLNLRLKKVPKQTNWDGIVLLPDLNIEELNTKNM